MGFNWGLCVGCGVITVVGMWVVGVTEGGRKVVGGICGGRRMVEGR